LRNYFLLGKEERNVLKDLLA